MSRFTHISFWVLVALALVGCDLVQQPENDLECPAGGDLVEATLLSVEPADGLEPRTPNVFDGGIILTGSANHLEALAIHELSIAGIPVINDGFNFDRFSVEIPWTSLTSLPRTEDDVVQLDVVALDTCGLVSAVGTFEVTIDPDPFIRVEALDMIAELPSTEDYIPANGTVPAVVTVTANPEAAGAVVTVASSAGGLTGVINAMVNGLPAGQVTLSGDGENPATASFLINGEDDGRTETVQITASAQEQIATAAVRIIGPPMILPALLDINAGQSTSVSVVSNGRAVSCQANPVAGVEVLAEGQNLMAGPAELSFEPITIRIVVDPLLLDDAAFAITCTDSFGQVARGEYQALVPFVP